MSSSFNSTLTYSPRLSDLVSTVIPNPAWTNASDGIIIEGQYIIRDPAYDVSPFTNRLIGPQSASDANNPNTNQVFRGDISRRVRHQPTLLILIFVAVLIRSLYEVFSRSPQTSAEAALIRSFITVQVKSRISSVQIIVS